MPQHSLMYYKLVGFRGFYDLVIYLGYSNAATNLLQCECMWEGSAQTIVLAAILRQKLHIKFVISPSHRILTPGQPVPAPTLQHQAPGRVATGVPIFKSLV